MHIFHTGTYTKCESRLVSQAHIVYIRGHLIPVKIFSCFFDFLLLLACELNGLNLFKAFNNA